jgi:hypothetical protein
MPLGSRSQGPLGRAGCREGVRNRSTRPSMALLSTSGRWRNTLLSKAKSRLPTVAQTVGFGLGRSKMLYLSMEVDSLPLRHPSRVQPGDIGNGTYPRSVPMTWVTVPRLRLRFTYQTANRCHRAQLRTAADDPVFQRRLCLISTPPEHWMPRMHGA